MPSDLDPWILVHTGLESRLWEKVWHCSGEPPISLTKPTTGQTNGIRGGNQEPDSTENRFQLVDLIGFATTQFGLVCILRMLHRKCFKGRVQNGMFGEEPSEVAHTLLNGTIQP